MYRQESTLKAARPLVSKWENILKEYGLSDGQLFYQGAQSVPASGPRVPDNRWLGDLNKAGIDTADNEDPSDVSFSRVPLLRTRRDIPAWALSDDNIAAYLLKKHPAVKRLCATDRERSQVNNARCAAARTVAIIYLAYRAGWQNCDIADLLGVKPGAIDERLYSIKVDAEEFFAKRKVVKDVLVHNCHASGDPQPKKCRCKHYIEHARAKEQVRQGIAEWLWVYPPKGKPYQSHGAIVAVRATKTPRSNTLEKAHLERNTEGNEDQQGSVAAYGATTLEWVQALIVPFRAGGREGMPVITQWVDQRRN